MGDIDSSSSEPECMGMEGAAVPARHVAPAKSLVGLVCKHTDKQTCFLRFSDVISIIIILT